MEETAGIQKVCLAAKGMTRRGAKTVMFTRKRANEMNVKVGIIGGSGLYQIEELEVLEEVKIQTPFGPPSDALTIGRIEGEKVAFLPRHGRGHRILPSQINSKANIWAMKKLGVERILGISAVGSLREQIHPLDIVLPDQLIDRTRTRDSSFFGEGVAAHISFADPYCKELLQILHKVCCSLGYSVHKGGVYLCIEGPQFSTRAESELYRKWGAHIIGMTAIPEVKLAREAEICYATVALVTDYDVWHTTEDVNIDMVIKNLAKGTERAKRIIKEALPLIPKRRECACATALRDAIITPPALIPKKKKEELSLFIKDYI